MQQDRRRPPIWVVGSSLVVLMTLLAGCGSPQDAAVRTVVAEFTAAVAADHGAAACRLLAPRTKSELEQNTGKPCAEALLDEDVPGQPDVPASADVDVFGTAAWLRTGSDTVFLARFQGGWKVSAAGCTKATSRMYDCVVKGG